MPPRIVDLDRYKWREVTGEPGGAFFVRHDYTILVLEGEQHLWDLGPDGTRLEHRVRRAGDYALTVGEAMPHLECGGQEGGVVFFGNHSPDGRLYEIFDDGMRLVMDVTMELLVADWQANSTP